MFNIFFKKCCFFHNNAYCNSNWRIATEYETISNHAISATLSNRVILWRNLAIWLASAEQIFENFKCLLLIINYKFVWNSLFLAFLDHFSNFFRLVRLSNWSIVHINKVYCKLSFSSLRYSNNPLLLKSHQIIMAMIFHNSQIPAW